MCKAVSMKKIILCASIILAGMGVAAFADEAPKDKTTIKPVEKSEFTQAQLLMFNSADRDFNGRVTQDEINQLNDKANEPKRKKTFQNLDADKNGFLSYDEIEARYATLSDTRSKNRGKDKVLQQYDQDSNGVITSGELDAYFEARRKKTEAKAIKNAQRDFKFKDADGSGTVSLDEYLESHKTASQVKFYNATYSENTSISRDESGDKLITRLENETFANALFEMLDKNEDGSLSASEQSSRAYKQAQTLSFRSVYVRSKTGEAFGANR